ncbi:type I secretion C-terminal target domain-containing protein, partial [Aeromonas taiwanensis]
AGGFTITAEDADGDPVAGGINLDVNVQDDVPVQGQGGGDSIDVEEESVPGIGGNDENDGLSYTVTNGTIVDNVSWGADGFGKVTGVSGTGQPAAVYDAVAKTYTISTTVYELVVNENGTYSFTLKDNLAHASGLDENWKDLLAGGFTITAEDADGDPVAGGINLDVNVQDDVPNISSAFGNSGITITVPYTPTSTPITYADKNIASFTWGADGAATTAATISGLGANYTASPVTVNSGTGLLSFSIYYFGTKVADISLDPAAGNNDSVTIYKLPGALSFTDLATKDVKAGGPGDYYLPLSSSSVDKTILITGYFDGPSYNGGTKGLVNPSSQGWAGGDNSQNTEEGESIKFSFFDYDASQANQINLAAPETVGAFSFVLDKFTGNGGLPTVTVRVTYGDESHHDFVFTAADNSTYVISGSGLFINNSTVPTTSFQNTSGILSFEIYNEVDGSQTFNIKTVSILTETATAPDLTIPLTLNLFDGDGDQASLAMQLKLDGTDADSPAFSITAGVAPIAVDLDQSGTIEYYSTQYGVTFDYGAGLNPTPWVAPSDGLLVYDYNKDGVINSSREMVFTEWGNIEGLTDREALLAYFDTNGDHQFNNVDAAWSDFGIWQDLNSDGVQQSGEFKTLAEWHIDNISLVASDGVQPHSEADGDVYVASQMKVQYEDGSSGFAEDVTFNAILSDEKSDESAVLSHETYKLNSDNAENVIGSIAVFQFGQGGDVLDLSELLVGSHGDATSLDSYLDFSSHPDSGKSTLTIDVDGVSGGTTHTIHFDNTDLTVLDGATRTDQQIIQDLLDQGNLKVDP